MVVVEVIVAVSAGLIGLASLYVLSIPTPSVNCKIACSCGQIQGTVSAASTLHCVCYCDDCQDLASKLIAKFPSTPSYVNENGGTHILTLFPSDVRITLGQDKLAQAKLKEHTATRRVYASCCGTPMFNATKKNIPFLGLLLTAIPDKSVVDVKSAQFHFWTKYATHPVPGGAPTVPLGLKLKMLSRFLLNGSKKVPHPVDMRQPATVL